MSTSDEIRALILIQRAQRQRETVRRDRLDRLQQRPARLAGVDEAGRPLVRSLGGGVLPLGMAGSVQGEIGQQGRSDGRGFDVGARRGRTERRRRVQLDKIAQVFFRVVGSDLVAYYVSDRQVKQIDQVLYSEYTLAKAWLILNERSEADITIVYRNGLAGSNLKFVWIDSQKVKRTEVKTDAIAQLEYYPLGGGQYRAGQVAQSVQIRRINRTTFTYPAGTGPYRRVRFQPWIQTVPLAAPADAYTVDPAPITPSTPAIAFAIVNETGIDQPAPEDQNTTLNVFQTEFTGNAHYWFGWIGPQTLEEHGTQFNFGGSYQGRDFEDRGTLFPTTQQFPNFLQTKIDFTAGSISDYKFHPDIPVVSTSHFTRLPSVDAAIGIIDGPPGGYDATCAAIGLPIVSRFGDYEVRKTFLGYYRGPSGYNQATGTFDSIYQLMLCTVDDEGTLMAQQIQDPPFRLKNQLAGYYKDRQFYYYNDEGTYDPAVPGTVTTETKIAIAADGTATETTRNLILPAFAAPSYATTNIGASNLVVNPRLF